MFSSCFSKQAPKEEIQATKKVEESQPKTLSVPEVKLNEINTAGRVGKSHHNYFKVMNDHQACKQMRKISKEQLAQHRSIESAWLSLQGIVYDVTVYMNYHPGGKILLDGCGKECSDLFNSYHPWVNAKYLLEKYKIGFLG